MTRKKVDAAEDPSAILLPRDLLDQMGVQAGDEIDLFVRDRTLILCPAGEIRRAEAIEKTLRDVFERRSSAYEQLAKGVE